MGKDAVTQTQCQYKYPVTLRGTCPHPPLADDKNNYCLFHSQNDNKDKETFWDGIQKKLQDKDFDFEGYYFPLGLKADFHGIEFTDANFSRAIFKDEAKFRVAKFTGKGVRHKSWSMISWFGNGNSSQEPDLSATIFIGKVSTNFRKAQFLGDGGPDFSYATFSGEGCTDFSGTGFSGKGPTNFTFAEFSGKGTVDFSRARFSKKDGTNFSGADFSECNVILFTNTIFSENCKFISARFPWRSHQFVVFQGTRDPIDLSKCSFLYSNPERLVFHNFKF